MINIVDHICRRPVHPFPARMAPAIVWDKLRKIKGECLRILDPMAGSGTTLVVGRAMGHIAYGVDRDPLAVMIAKAWCDDVDKERLLSKAEEVLEKAKNTVRILPKREAYPSHADDETKRFVRYWFDLTNRKQLAGLSKHISLVRDENVRVFLWTGFSRMIITKKVGVSLAMDISHSRPHRVYDKAPVKAFEVFLKAVKKVVDGNAFSSCECMLPKPIIRRGDSRELDFKKNFFDIVITSPPYLNAIDYMRGHKMALVWMKNSIKSLRELRGTNIGAEVKSVGTKKDRIINVIAGVGDVEKLGGRQKGFLMRYVLDMDSVCSEITRVLKPNGSAVFVVGDSTLQGVFIKNSEGVKRLAEHYGLKVEGVEERALPENSRYLPPPSNNGAGSQLQRRMRKEVILTMRKAC